MTPADLHKLTIATFLASLAFIPALAMAGNLQVDVVDQNGASVPDAVITAVPLSGKLPARTQGKAIIDQIHRQFAPIVSVIQTGTLVTFPNKDNIEHDVYSFSPAKPFELNLYSGVAAKPVEFDKPGLVVLGCNIHDKMIAYVQVVDTPYFSKTDASGHARLGDLPDEDYDVSAWSYKLSDTKTSAHLTAHPDRAAPTRFVLQLTAN
jgi:plastocyanin